MVVCYLLWFFFNFRYLFNYCFINIFISIYDGFRVCYEFKLIVINNIIYFCFCVIYYFVFFLKDLNFFYMFFM